MSDLCGQWWKVWRDVRSVVSDGRCGEMSVMEGVERCQICGQWWKVWRDVRSVVMEGVERCQICGQWWKVWRDVRSVVSDGRCGEMSDLWSWKVWRDVRSVVMEGVERCQICGQWWKVWRDVRSVVSLGTGVPRPVMTRTLTQTFRNISLMCRTGIYQNSLNFFKLATWHRCFRIFLTCSMTRTLTQTFWNISLLCRNGVSQNTFWNLQLDTGVSGYFTPVQASTLTLMFSEYFPSLAWPNTLPQVLEHGSYLSGSVLWDMSFTIFPTYLDK